MKGRPKKYAYGHDTDVELCQKRVEGSVRVLFTAGHSERNYGQNGGHGS